jgi:hypothetical protein
VTIVPRIDRYLAKLILIATPDCSAAGDARATCTGTRLDHIRRMATRSSESLKRKGGNGAVKVLGRSAATGRFVLMPASKPGKASMKEARTAVRYALEKKL